MKLRIVVLLCACSTACAELPPVVGAGGNAAPNPVVAIPKPTTSLTTTYEMMKRIDQMQAEVQQLTGKVEEQAFQIEELKKQQKTMYTDFDDRLQSIENKPAADQAATESPVSDSTVPAESGETGISTPVPAVVGQPENKTPEVPASEASVEKATESNPAVTPTTSAAPVQVSESEKQEYQQAYDDLRNGKTAQAITEFNAYLTNHPGSGYASNAQYWLGEAHRVNLDNVSARKAFEYVVKNYPDSAKVPDALLKLGYIETEENNTAKAREIFTRITSEFANTKAAVLAQKKLLTLDGNKP